jgi:hypothetical protein
MASFLKKPANLIGRSVVRPQENVRLEVPHEYLGQYIRLIKESVPLVPTELLFNIDESGFSDWEERKPKWVPIPTEARETTLHYPGSRKIRHQTLVRCVTAAGDTYCRLLVTSYPTARALSEHQIRDGIDLQTETCSSWPCTGATATAKTSGPGQSSHYGRATRPVTAKSGSPTTPPVAESPPEQNNN